MVDLKAICDRIRYLGSLPETPESRAEVEAAFAMKAQGVQSVAARVLGHWGGRWSVELLKEWLLNNYKRRNPDRGLEKVAVEALSECVEPEDAPWMLDIYFNEPKRSYFRDIIFDLPPDVVTERLIAECDHPNANHRFSALVAIYAMGIVDAFQYFEKLKTDPDPSVRTLAKDCSEYPFR